MPSPPPNAPVIVISRSPKTDNRNRLEVCPPGTSFVGASIGDSVQLPGDAYALFAGEEVAKALNAALCDLLDNGKWGDAHGYIARHKPVLGLVRDTLSASILGRKCAEGTL